MDYEKAYKEAMEKVRSLHDNANEISKLIDLREELEGIFPELAESKDERMIKYFKDLAPFDKAEELYEKYGFSHKDAIAWLEKKCEQKSVKVPKFKVGDFIQFNGMGHTRYTVKEVCGLSHYINTCNKRMDMSYTDANFELVEQKPAEWSEEDEAIYYGVIETEQYMLDVVNGIKKFAVGSISIKEECTRELNWLKSLKDRVQPKQEWSEENKRITDKIFVIAYDALERGKISTDENSKICGWLVRQKTRYGYKPTKEQMDILCKVSTYGVLGSSVRDVLQSLYNDLKKL